MNKNNNIIVINNKHYDAKTGTLLVRHSASHDAPVHNVHRKPARHAQAHTPTHSRTLMRQAVKRPSSNLKRRLKIQTRIDSPAEPLLAVNPAKPSLKSVDARLLRYTQKLKASGRISHFSPTTFSAVSATPSSSSRPNQAADAAVVSVTVAAPRSHHLKKSKTTAELLDYVLQQATSHEQKLPKQHRRNLFKRHASV